MEGYIERASMVVERLRTVFGRAAVFDLDDERQGALVLTARLEVIDSTPHAPLMDELFSRTRKLRTA